MLKEISGGSKAFEKEIIELFIKNAKRDVEIIRKAIINQDKEIIRQKMHGLKSSLLIFGLNQLAQELSTIENSDDPLAIAAIKISEIRRRIMNAGEGLTKILAQY
jgi:HPt (histidine-containing phosphotransfer) domain-containing protein